MAFRRRRLFVLLALLVVAAAVAVVAFVLWPRDELPPYIAVGNGRLEATEYDVATLLPGQLVELSPREGDTVHKGAVVGRVAAEQVGAQWDAARAQAQAAANALEEALAGLDAAQGKLALARRSLRRSERRAREGELDRATLDRDRMALHAAEQGVAAAQARVAQARAAQSAASATAQGLGSQAADRALVAPATGRVLYRLVEPGVVLPAGAKVLTLLDLSDLYMTIFLPTRAAGQAAIGGEARIVLDAFPDAPIPAKVSFVSPRNQFTPRQVETEDEREKLMFRVKVRVDGAWLADAENTARAKPGMPGVAYVRLDSKQPWPAALDGKAPPGNELDGTAPDGRAPDGQEPTP